MADKDWYEQVVARYGAVEAPSGAGPAASPQPATDLAPTPPAPPSWLSQAMERYGVPPESLTAPGASAEADSILTLPVVATMPAARHVTARALTTLVVAGLVLMAGGVGAYVAVGGGQSASAAVALAVTNTLGAHTADVTMTVDSNSAGSQTFSLDASGVTDFTNHQTDMSMTIDSAGQSVTERVLYDGQTAFMNVGHNLIGEILPGKSWLSLDLGQVTSGSSSLPGGSESDPTAMLQLLGAQGNTVTPLGSSVIDGNPVQGYDVLMTPASINRAIAQEHLPSWLEQMVSQVHESSITYDVYINGANQLQRLSSVVHVTAQGQSIVEDIAENFSNYGVPVTITDPPASQVAPFDQFLQVVGQLNSSSTA